MTTKNTALVDPSNTVDLILTLPKTKFRNLVLNNPDEALKQLEADLKNSVKSLVPDEINIENKSHQDALRSVAATLGRSKKPIIDKIKNDTKEMDLEIAQYKSFGNRAVAIVQDIQDKTRQPLTDYENDQKRKEEERKQHINDRIDVIRSLGKLDGDETKESLMHILESLDEIDIDEEFAEYQIDAINAKKEAQASVNEAISSIVFKQQMKDQQAAKAEAEIKQKQADAFARFNQIPASMMGKSRSEIGRKIDDLRGFAATPEKFGEYADQINDGLPNIIAMLEMMRQNSPELEEVKSEPDDLKNTDDCEQYKPDLESAINPNTTQCGLEDWMIGHWQMDYDTVCYYAGQLLEAIHNGEIPGLSAQ